MTERTDQIVTGASTDVDGDGGFRDAEAFLAELGVERRPIVVRLDPEDGETAPAGTPDLAAAAAPLTGDAANDLAEPTDGPDDDRSAPPVSAVEAARLVAETIPPDEVTAALSYIRRSTASQPAAEGRLRSRLADRDHDQAVIDEAMRRARAQRLVDDDALSAAMVAEWRAKGHAPGRVRTDLRRRGFDESVVERAVGRIEDEDQSAVAFTLARRRAETLAHLPPETAYRRVVGYVARRGYGEGLARKAARDAVYDQRHDERVAGH